LGKIWDWGKKIANWFHFSKLGSGHSESIEWNKTKHLILPAKEVRYEGAWWNRTFKIDGYPDTLEAERAKQAAHEYSNIVCMGNIQVFRRYFETSLNQSSRFMLHVQQFLDGMLNPKGKDLFTRKMQQCFPRKTRMREYIKTPQVINLVMGFTRKRELLVPEWSDVPSLWIPSTGSQS